MADQSITIVGGLGKDPELRFTPGGQAMAKFGVACSHRFQRKGSTEWEEETTWFNVICWGPLAENVCVSLRKGSRVVVVGTIKTRSWEGDDGTKRYGWDLQADHVAPSLRWATAQVEQIVRDHPSAGYEPEEEF